MLKLDNFNIHFLRYFKYSLPFLIFKAKEAEKQAMVEGIRENGVEDSDKVIRAVLAERHAQELRDLEKQFAAEKKIMVDDALNKLNEKYDHLRENMMKKHQLQLEALQVSI